VAFTGDLIRCLVIQESTSGRQLLYDNHRPEVVRHGSETRSRATKRTSSPSTSPGAASRMAASYRGEEGRPSLRGSAEGRNASRVDDQLMEMIFGAIPVADIAITTKLHHLRHRNQVMLTSVFRYVPKVIDTDAEETSGEEEQPRTTPTQRPDPSSSVKIDLKASDDHVLDASPSPSRISLRKRSISVGPKPPEGGYGVASGLSVSSDSSLPPSHIRPQSSTIALAVLVDVLPRVRAVQEMMNSHYTLVQYRLRLLVQIIYESLARVQKKRLERLSGGGSSDHEESGRRRHMGWDRHHSLPPMAELLNRSLDPFGLQGDYILKSAVRDFQQCICTYMNYPRLQPVAWLHVVSIPDRRKSILDMLLREIATLMPLFDSVSGNLLAGALTAIMSYHMSWVLSIMSTEERNSSPLEWISHRNPVDRQVAQLFGCVTKPARFVRVIVLGEDKKLVRSLLFVLSYIIRCTASFLQTLDITGSYVDRVVEQKKELSAQIKATPQSSALPTQGASIWSQPSAGPSASDGEREPVELDAIELAPIFWKEHAQSPHSSSIPNPYRSVGNSLFGSYCKNYSSEFVLMGLSPRVPNLKSQIARDLWSQCKFWPYARPEGDYTPIPSRCSSRSFNMETASCIVINVDNRETNIFHFEPGVEDSGLLFKNETQSKFPHLKKRVMVPSKILSNALRAVGTMYQNHLPMEGCILYLEDIFAQIWAKSNLVRKLVSDMNPKGLSFTCSQVASLLNLPSTADVIMLATMQHHLQPSDKLCERLDPS